jgi:diadenosine tetraphosphatase ApaH/serine/threonine PP2A family protein phosphatase
MECSEIRAFIVANPTGFLPEGVVVDILTKLMELLLLTNNVLVLSAPIRICGDLHGQLFDLLHLFNESGGFTANKQFLFLGDYVDRGRYSLHTLLYLACLKIEFPHSVHLLRGNHECRAVSRRLGFCEEILRAYGSSVLWASCQSVFDLMPIAAVVDRELFCVHGGLSPDVPLISRITELNRRKEVPVEGEITDLLWSDPGERDGWSANPRGTGQLFGREQSHAFCWLNRISCIVRAHEMAEMGFMMKHGDSETPYRVLTLFSAPAYDGGTNEGAFMACKCDSGEPRRIVRFSKVTGEKRRGKEFEALSKLPAFRRDT